MLSSHSTAGSVYLLLVTPSATTVSYTHLDVYKRQMYDKARELRPAPASGQTGGWGAAEDALSLIHI